MTTNFQKGQTAYQISRAEQMAEYLENDALCQLGNGVDNKYVDEVELVKYLRQYTSKPELVEALEPYIKETAVIEKLADYVLNSNYAEDKTITNQRLSGLEIDIDRLEDEIAVVGSYKIKRTTDPGPGNVATYQLLKDDQLVAGDDIKIPKTTVFHQIYVKVCEIDNIPVAGLNVGDKYLQIDFSDGSHQYVKVKDFETPYWTGGDGIEISDTREIRLTNILRTDIAAERGRSRIINATNGGRFELTQDSNKQTAYVGTTTEGDISARISATVGEERRGGLLDVTTSGIYYTNGVRSTYPKHLRTVPENELAIRSQVDAKVSKEANASTGIGKLSVINDGPTNTAGVAFDSSNQKVNAFIGVKAVDREDAVAIQLSNIDKTGLGTRLSMTQEGIYYTTEKSTAAISEADKIITKAELEEVDPDPLSEETIRYICQ